MNVRTHEAGSRRKRSTRRIKPVIQQLESRHLLATIAIQDGNWHDDATWNNGVPDSQTRAIISQGVTVELSGVDHRAKEIVAHGTLKVPEHFGGSTLPSDPAQLGNDKVKVFFDGELVGSTQGSQLWNHTDGVGIGGVNGNTRTHAGVQASSADVTFSGRIDDLLNYNRALIADEVSQLHTNGRGAVYLAPTDGLGAAWNFGNGSLTDVANGDLIDDNGVFIGGAPNTSGWYLDLDGVDDQVNVPPSTELNQGTFPEKTISVWFRVDQTSGRQVIYEQGGATRGLSIYLDGDTLYAGGWNTSSTQSGWQGDWVNVENVSPNEWHHVVLVLDGDAPQTTTSLNGNTKTLTTRWMHLNSGGVFQIGTTADRYDQGDFVLTLTGTDPNADHIIETATGTIDVTDNDGFLMTATGGSLQFYGEEKLSYTKLAATAAEDANQITVANVIERNFTNGTSFNGEFLTSAADDGVLNWEAGDEIVIASSSLDYREEDVRSIVSVNDNGNGTSTIVLDSPLSHRHFGESEAYSNASRSLEIDMRAEVGLLRRNVRIQGTAAQDTDDTFGDRANATYVNTQRPDFVVGGTTNEVVQDVTNGVGAHTMIMAGSGQITVDGVQLDLMGQAGRIGRYPIHWHVAGDRTGDVLRNTSITNSNNRGVTIHGTQNLQIEGVLLHDIHGHGFFFEDGVETGNELTANIAFGIHRVGRRLSANNFNQDETYFDPFTVDLHDDLFVKGPRGVLSAAFWVTNPNNDFVGNVTAGSQGMGFWYLGVREPLGASAATGLYDGYKPFEAPMGRNEYSTVHSTGTGFGLGEPGFDPPFFTEFKDGTFNGIASHLTSYKNHVGTWVETDITFDEYMAADNHVQFRSFDELEMRNSLIVGDSRGNSAGNYDAFNRHPRQLSVVGIGIYQEGINVIDTHFAGFQGSDAYMFNFQNNDRFNRFASTFQGITFEGGDRDGQLNATPALATRRQFNNDVKDMTRLHDVDGTLTGTTGATLVFNNPFLIASDAVEVGTHLYLTTGRHFGKLTLDRISGSAASMPSVDVTSAGGETTQMDRDNDFEQVTLLNDGDTRIKFGTLGNWGNGFDLDLTLESDGTPSGASGVFVLENLPSGFQVNNAVLAGNVNQVRNASVSSYYVAGNGDIWAKVFSNDGKKLRFRNP